VVRAGAAGWVEEVTVAVALAEALEGPLGVVMEAGATAERVARAAEALAVAARALVARVVAERASCK